MRIRVYGLGVLIGLVAILAAAAPASALVPVPTADLALRLQFQGRAAVGKTAMVVVERHSYGPNPTLDNGSVLVDLLAPGGTVFGPAFEDNTGGYSFDACHWYVPHRHVRCEIGGMLYPDNDNPSGVTVFSVWHLPFVVQARCTTPGRVQLIYAGDPKKSNNSVTFHVGVSGVPAAECAPKPAPPPLPVPPTTPAATPAATVSATPSDQPPTTAPATTEPAPDPGSPTVATIAAAGPSDLPRGPTVIVAGVAALLVLSGVAVWAVRRARRDVTPPG